MRVSYGGGVLDVRGAAAHIQHTEQIGDEFLVFILTRFGFRTYRFAINLLMAGQRFGRPARLRAAHPGR